jgi:hypothetical protein
MEKLGHKQFIDVQGTSNVVKFMALQQARQRKPKAAATKHHIELQILHRCINRTYKLVITDAFDDSTSLKLVEFA